MSQRLLGRFFMKPWVMRRTSWAGCEKNFTRAHEKLKKELLEFPKDRLTERVLVDPMPGLEDSSRYWSAAMIARHLTIGGLLMEEIVLRLSRYQVIEQEADTAAIKPEESRNDGATLQEYALFGDEVLERIRQGLGEKSSGVVYAHPWFGNMTSKDWLFLMGLHTRVHLKQLRAIRRGLKV
jgi:hypothetical protein